VAATAATIPLISLHLRVAVINRVQQCYQTLAAGYSCWLCPATPYLQSVDAAQEAPAPATSPRTTVPNCQTEFQTVKLSAPLVLTLSLLMNQA
jgi:hypothetical protein